MAKQVPVWVELLIVKVIKDYVPAEALREAVINTKHQIAQWLKDEAAKTSTPFDDKVADLVADALTGCSPDAQFLCTLMQNGTDFVMDKLKELAANTDSAIDDAVVELVTKALAK